MKLILVGTMNAHTASSQLKGFSPIRAALSALEENK
jgi:hypothetical protein